MKQLLKHPIIIRLKHWEYWNSTLVYLPLYPYWLWLSIKARSFYFLTAANPRIKNGGFIMESKMDVYNLLPQSLYPKTVRFDAGAALTKVLNIIDNTAICYPFIAKPDIGERGLGVKKIHTETELTDYIQDMPVPFLVQQFVPYEKEVGIFFCKLPGQHTGQITGIVNKEPVTIVGDGKSTLTTLVKNNDRYLLQWKQIKAMYPHMLNDVLENGRAMVLVPYGNHSRGSKFTDETYRVSPKLTATLNEICNQIPEFYYGRLDIRFDSWEDLESGENYSIIEVNGSGSEPTHIYDPKHSIFFAWQEIIRHWQILYSISKANNKKGIPYITLSQGQKEVRSFREIDALLSVRTW